MTTTKKAKLIYPEESYKIVGIIYEVFKKLHYGYREKFYQKAITEELNQNGISFKRELYFPLFYKNKKVGRYFVDFLIDDKIVLEIKVADDFYQSHISQVLSYLKSNNLRLGILAVFTKNGVKIKRIVN